jgi:hypothetical protein
MYILPVDNFILLQYNIQYPGRIVALLPEIQDYFLNRLHYNPDG